MRLPLESGHVNTPSKVAWELCGFPLLSRVRYGFGWRLDTLTGTILHWYGWMAVCCRSVAGDGDDESETLVVVICRNGIGMENDSMGEWE